MEKGFTIIELIVVIAIIAVLAAIVLVNVTQYIEKAKFSAVKADMNSMVAVGADYYVNYGTYVRSGVNNPSNGVDSQVCEVFEGKFFPTSVNDRGYSMVCLDGPQKWVVAATKWSTSNPGVWNIYWCVDSTGNKNDTATPEGVTANYDCSE